MSEYIPFEIQTEIIKRLPAKSAVKFRLVSKPWNSYIGSSKFIIAHHHCNIHRQPHHLLAWCRNPVDVTDDRYVTVFDDDTFYQQDFTPKVPLFTKQSTILSFPKVIDCSLGLVCLYGNYHNPDRRLFKFRTKMASFWNPLTRKSIEVVLPYSMVVLPYPIVVGFGVCPVTFDPTLVNISHGDRQHWEVEVFTLSSGTWKSIVSSNMPRKTVYLKSSDRCSQVVIDRFIYWGACEWRIVAKDAKSQDVNLIVSFDMTTHEFEVIDLPDSLSHPFDMTLSKIRESIVVVDYISYSLEDVYAVWMMEDTKTKSFSKLYTIKTPNPSLNLKMVLGFRKSGAAIMETHDEDFEESATIAVYEPRSEQINKLGIYGIGRSFFVSSYMETLLLLDQVDCHIYSYIHE